MTTPMMFNVPVVGKSYNHRIVVAVYIGLNILGRETIMVDYRYSHEPEDVKPAKCSVATFRSQTGRGHWYQYDKEEGS